MNKVAIVYWSGTGNTEQMAQAVAEGVKNAGGEANVLTCGLNTGRMVRQLRWEEVGAEREIRN